MPALWAQRFTSSGLFRLNANQSRVDVWLVYRCEKCEGTYNLTVYERVHPRQLAKLGIYEALLANDKTLAGTTARNIELLKKNGVAPVWDGAECAITGPLPAEKGTAFAFTIKLPPGLRLRTDTALAKKLEVSRATIQKQIKKGAITLAGGAPCPKHLHGLTQLQFSSGLL